MRRFPALLALACAQVLACGGGGEAAPAVSDTATTETEPSDSSASDSGAGDSGASDSGTGDLDSGAIDDSALVDSVTLEDTTTTSPDTFVADTSAPPDGGASGWTPLPPVPTGFAARRSHTAEWTGTAMIVWGGAGASEKPIYGDGARYEPASNTWKTIASPGLAPRYLHASAWSGTEMLVIGGILGTGGVGYTAAKDGALYNPATDTWSAPITLPGSVRYSASAVWSTTTSEFLVFGGFSGSANLGDGYAYKPSTETWRTLSAVGAPPARNAHEAAWNGSRMILIGGSTGSGPYYAADAFAYDPVTDTWQTLTPPTGYVGRNNTTAGLVNGDRVAFFGGRASWKTADLLGDGLLFEGTTVSTIPEPAASILPNPKRSMAAGFWSSGRIYVWGGHGSVPYAAVDNGASFDPATKTWTAMPSANAPSARYAPTAVVNPANGHAYVWGGYNGSVAFADGATFKP